MGFTRRKIAKPKEHDDAYLVFFDLEPKNRFETMDNNLAVWPAYRERVLADWIKKKPGTRPRVWWWVDAPEPRREQISGYGRIYPALDNDRNFRHGCGLPDSWWLVDGDAGNPPVYESQARYLQRHELLMPGELKRLTDEDFKPVTIIRYENRPAYPKVRGDSTTRKGLELNRSMLQEVEKNEYSKTTKKAGR